jgi:hypothetical protein
MGVNPERLLVDAYFMQEHDDAVEVIAWLARQPWSSGSVGMFRVDLARSIKQGIRLFVSQNV